MSGGPGAELPREQAFCPTERHYWPSRRRLCAGCQLVQHAPNARGPLFPGCFCLVPSAYGGTMGNSLQTLIPRLTDIWPMVDQGSRDMYSRVVKNRNSHRLYPSVV